jgi:hypothetical protein
MPPKARAIELIPIILQEKNPSNHKCNPKHYLN